MPPHGESMETRFTYKIVMPESERLKFKKLAKVKGMTISGYLTQLIRRELKENSELLMSADDEYGYISHYKD